MTDDTEPTERLDTAGFEQLYAGHTPEHPTVSWDLGAPQPLVVELADRGAFTGHVADLGCGFGENAMFLAARGLKATGLDGAPSAIARARATAATRGLDVHFAVAEAVTLTGWDAAFDTVLDCAIYHCLNDTERHRCAAALHRATRPGARLHLLAFSPAMRGIFPDRHVVTEENLRTTLGAYWNVDTLEPALYTSAGTLEELRVSAQAILGETQVDPAGLAALTADAHDRVLLPMWHLAAGRKSV